MKKFLVTFAFVLVLLSIPAVAQTVNIFGASTANKDTMKIDYMRVQITHHIDQFTGVFRYDGYANKLNLGYVCIQNSIADVTVGRQLTGMWFLVPPPHVMAEPRYGVALGTFSVTTDGIGIQKLLGPVSVYGNIYDGPKELEYAAAIAVAQDGLEVGGFIQKEKGWGVESSYKNSIFSSRVMLIKPEITSTPVLLIDAKAEPIKNLFVIGQWERVNESKSNWYAGCSYQYLKNSHLKLFYDSLIKGITGTASFFF